jgi:hypothetical protein
LTEPTDKKNQDLKARLGLLDTKKGAAPAPKPAEASAPPAQADDEGDDEAALSAPTMVRDVSPSDLAPSTSSSAPAASAAPASPRPTPEADTDYSAPPVQGSRMALLVVGFLVAAVFFGGGYTLGKIFESRGIENYRIADAITIRDYLKNHKTAGSNTPTLDAIDEHKAAIAEIAAKARAVQGNGEYESIQEDLVKFLKRCADYDVQMDIEGAMRGQFYAGELTPLLSRFSGSVIQLYAATKAVSHEAGLLGYVLGRQQQRAENPNALTRQFVRNVGDIDGVPWGAGGRIEAMQKPERPLDPTTGMEGPWQVAIKEVGQEKGRFVSPSDVMLVSLEPEIREVESEFLKFAFARVVDRVLDLDTLAKTIEHESLLKRVEELAKKPEYFTF